MIPPRIGLDDENLRTYAPGTATLRGSRWQPPSPFPRALHDAIARRPFSRMAPRKPDTQWVHFRCVQGQRSRTWGPHLSAPARNRYPMRRAPCPPRAPYGLLMRPLSSGMHDLLSRRFSLHFPGVQVSIISALPADFDRQFDYGCHSRRTCDFDVRSHASFSRARSADRHERRHRNTPG